MALLSKEDLAAVLELISRAPIKGGEADRVVDITRKLRILWEEESGRSSDVENRSEAAHRGSK